MPSPSASTFHYVYGETDQYFDANNSESQSAMSSPVGQTASIGVNGTIADLQNQYEIPYVADFSAVDGYPSPEHEAESPEAQSNTAAAKSPAKRKRENRYKNAPPSVLSRRRAQNRASQRAYRERKDQRIKDLEQLLNEAKQRNDTLSSAYAELHAEYVKLKTSQYQEGPPAYSADLSFDHQGTVGLANNDRIDLDLFVYPDMSSNYTL